MVTTVPVTPADEEFLYQVYASTRQAEVAAWGWPPAQQDAFLRMQFQAQSRSYAMQFPGVDHRILRYNDQPVGRIILYRTKEAILVVDLALLSEFRGHGLGGDTLRSVQAEAAENGQVVRFSVVKGNPAKRLYDRLGFVVVDEGDLHYALEWRPVAIG